MEIPGIQANNEEKKVEKQEKETERKKRKTRAFNTRSSPGFFPPLFFSCFFCFPMEFIPSLVDIQIILYNAMPEQVMRLAQICDNPGDLLIDRKRKHPLDDVTAAIEQGVPFSRLPKLPPLDIRQVLIELDFFYRYIQTGDAQHMTKKQGIDNPFLFLVKRWCAAILQAR